MVAKEFYLGQISLEEIGDEESTLLQDPRDDSDAEAEEALSLCDLPLYSNSSISSQWGGNNFSKEYEKNASQSNNNNKEDVDDDDFFEFFSEDFKTNSTTHHHHHRTVSDNIIFCGKLIPFKDTPKNGNTDQSSSNITQKGSNTLVSWRSNSSSISNSKAMMMTGNNNKGYHGGAKGNNNFTSSSSCEYSSIGKVSLLRSPTKSRWFLFMFGMTRLSTNSGNMELRDIRNRQSRNSRRTKLAAATTPENRGEVVQKTMAMKEGKGNCKGLWKVLRSISMGLGCSSSKLANDVVKAAFV